MAAQDQDVSLRLAQRLVRQGRLDQPLAKTALARSRERQIRLEDALIECGVSEHILLRHLADLYRTQLVSTEKLEHAKVSSRVLRMVPRSLAQRHLVVPLVLTQNGELVVATADPESVDLVKDLQLSSQAREIRTTVARPAAVVAAIRKFYDGDHHAFASLGTETSVLNTGLTLELTDNQGGTAPANATFSQPPPAARRTPSSPRQPAVRARPAQPARAASPQQGAAQMAPPTAAGAARAARVVPDHNPAIDLAHPVIPAPPAAPRAAKPAPRPAVEPKLELALSDEERAHLPEAGRNRSWEGRDQPLAQPPAPSLFGAPGLNEGIDLEADYSQMGSLPPSLGAFAAPASAVATKAARPPSSAPPALFASEAPPVATQVAAPAAADSSSLPPSLGYFPSDPPGAFATAHSHDSGATPATAPALAASSNTSLPPSLFGSLTPPPTAASPAAGQAQVSALSAGDSSSGFALEASFSLPPLANENPGKPMGDAKAGSAFDLPTSLAPSAAGAAGNLPPVSFGRWMSGLDSTPPPSLAGDVQTPQPGPYSVTSPLSIPPEPGALESAVPYALTHGQDLVRAPLLLARSLIALSERPHGALAGHSVVLSELLRLLATELGLSREEQEHAELAGLLHDVAKSRSRHLTSYAVWQYVEYEQIARQQYLLPVHLLASVGLPAAVVGGLTHLFERVDGQGFPNNLQGDAIPLLSRLLALGDSYLDFVLSASNPFGRVLTPREALTTLKQKAGTLFDAALVERLTALVVERGLDLRGRQRQVTL